MFLQVSRRVVQPNTTTGGTSLHRMVAMHLHTDGKKELGASDTNKNPVDHGLMSLAHDVQMYKRVSSDLVKQKWHEAYNFYAAFTHMDEIRVAQDKVLAIQVSSFAHNSYPSC